MKISAVRIVAEKQSANRGYTRCCRRGGGQSKEDYINICLASSNRKVNSLIHKSRRSAEQRRANWTKLLLVLEEFMIVALATVLYSEYALNLCRYIIIRSYNDSLRLIENSWLSYSWQRRKTSSLLCNIFCFQICPQFDNTLPGEC